MKANGYIIAAALLILLVFFTYFVNFYVILGGGVSDDSAIWGQFADYVGGILNPLLSFVSIVLLIKSLMLQSEANISLRAELKNNEKTEKLRSFETLFFNLVDSQKKLFDSLRIESMEGSEIAQLMGAKAVMKIEDKIEEIRHEGGDDHAIKEYLEMIDEDDQVFGLSRAFYVIVLIVAEKLRDSEGFSAEDRKAHFMTLVNFTDFAQLRLVMISIQFMDYESAKYLRSSIEFKKVIEELGLSYELY